MSAHSPKREEEEEEEERQQQQQQQQQPVARSPSPSALSTASSASPLIRADSTSGSASASSQRARAAASSPPHQQARRPAPTSIAAAQLQQHQANKLAQMARGQPSVWHKQEVDYRLEAADEHKSRQASKLDGANSAKGFGCNLANMLTYRASRFNEFWSVNKMRYMNLACLLMTLVCLLTILLFSKSSNVTEGGLEKPAAPRWSSAKLANSDGRRRVDGRGWQADQTQTIESMDALERQPLVMGSSRRRSPLDLDADSGALDESKHEPADRPAELFDDILQDARRQLKRQQEMEREMDESASGSSSSPTGNSSEIKAEDVKTLPLAGSNLGQLFESLDKVIKSQLFDANSTQARPSVVSKDPQAATIIMSFAASGNSSGAPNPMGTLLDNLMAPIFRRPPSLLLDEKPRAKSAPRAFATITIRSEPAIRGLSAAGWPLGAFNMRPSEGALKPLFAMPASGAAPPGGGLFQPLMRAVGELVAEQVAQLEAANSTETGNATSMDALSQQASQRASVVRVPLASGANSSANATDSLDEEVETFDVGQLLASRVATPPLPFMRWPLSPLFRSLYTGPRGRPGSIMISSRSGALPEAIFEPAESAPSPFGLLPATPFGPSLVMPHMIMMRSSGGQSATAPMLRALLAGPGQPEQRDKEASSNSARRADQADETADSEGWDEQFASGSASRLMARHRSSPDSNEDESLAADPSPFLASVSSGASSLIENMLESTNGGPPVGRLSGTIKQIFRGPGMTVERILELPGDAQQSAHFRRARDEAPQIRAVAPGVRSQSISRADEEEAPSESAKPAGFQRVSSLAAQLQERSDTAELEREFARPLGVSPLASMSRVPVTGFISRLFSNLNRPQEPGEPFEGSLPSLQPLGAFLSGSNSIFGPLPALGKAQRQQRTFAERSMDDGAEADSTTQDQDEQQESEAADNSAWPARMPLGSVRIKAGPPRHEQPPLAARFAGPAESSARQQVGRVHAAAGQQDNSRMQRAMKSAPIRSINEHQQPDARPSSAFTSPNSALFGFPAMKAQAPAPVAGNKPEARASDTSARPFVYHSNHELAGSIGRSTESRQQQQQQQAHSAPLESRSSYQHRASTGVQSVAGVPAAIGMGRRLDEGELIS